MKKIILIFVLLIGFFPIYSNAATTFYIDQCAPDRTDIVEVNSTLVNSQLNGSTILPSGANINKFVYRYFYRPSSGNVNGYSCKHTDNWDDFDLDYDGVTNGSDYAPFDKDVSIAPTAPIDLSPTSMPFSDLSQATSFNSNVQYLYVYKTTHNLTSEQEFQAIYAHEANTACLFMSGSQDIQRQVFVQSPTTDPPSGVVTTNDEVFISYNILDLIVDGIPTFCPTSSDNDADGVGSNDNCPSVANYNQEDIDNDGLGDACDTLNDLDIDSDGINNDIDNCPNSSNPNQLDSDNDGLGDACDTLNNLDSDSDTIPDDIDNCPSQPNTNQLDSDNDGIGDACDSSNNLDSDNDTIEDSIDNCPNHPNTDQLDTDNDGIGDVCDSSNGSTGGTGNGNNGGTSCGLFDCSPDLNPEYYNPPSSISNYGFFGTGTYTRIDKLAPSVTIEDINSSLVHRQETIDSSELRVPNNSFVNGNSCHVFQLKSFTTESLNNNFGFIFPSTTSALLVPDRFYTSDQIDSAFRSTVNSVSLVSPVTSNIDPDGYDGSYYHFISPEFTYIWSFSTDGQTDYTNTDYSYLNFTGPVVITANVYSSYHSTSPSVASITGTGSLDTNDYVQTREISYNSHLSHPSFSSPNYSTGYLYRISLHAILIGPCSENPIDDDGNLDQDQAINDAFDAIEESFEGTLDSDFGVINFSANFADNFNALGYTASCPTATLDFGWLGINKQVDVLADFCKIYDVGLTFSGVTLPAIRSILEYFLYLFTAIYIYQLFVTSNRGI